MPRYSTVLLMFGFLLYLVLPVSSGAQEARALIESAAEQFTKGEYEQAESTLLGLLDRQPESPDAHYWLSRVLDALGQHGEAQNAVEKALSIGGRTEARLIQLARLFVLRDKKNNARKVLDEVEQLAPDNADVYYYRGRTYGKIRLAIFRPQAAEREFRQLDVSYRRAIELDPEHPDAYFRLGYAYETVKDEPENALEWYFKQASVNPSHDQALYRLVICAVQLSKFNQGFGLLQHAAELQGEAVNPLIDGLSGQLEAYYYHTREQHERAYHAIGRYVAVLSDIDPQRVGVYGDLSVVASAEEGKDFREAAPQERERLWRSFWAARDPDPTTRINERLVEHYRRIMFSRLHFSKGKEPWDRRGEIYIRLGHPDDRQHLILKSGEDVVNAIFPTGIREVDMIREMSRQRFRMEINTGAPAQGFGEFSAQAGRVTKSVAFPIESWVYVPYGLEIFFSDQRNSRIFDYPLQVIDLPAQVTNFGSTDRLAYNFLNSPRKQAEDLIRKVPESHRHDYGGDPLIFVYYLASFKGADGRAEVEVAYGVPSAQLGSVEDGLGERTWLSGRLALRDPEYRYAQGTSFAMGPLKRAESEKEQLSLSTGAFRFQARPGEYQSAVALRDSLSQKFGIYTAPLYVADFTEKRLQISDVKLAASIVPAEGTGLLVRNGLHITPHPARLYSPSTPVFIYYEIYNLSQDDGGRTGFRTELEIAAREPRRNVVLRLLTALGSLVSQRSDDQSTYVTFEDSGTSADDFKYTSIDTADLAPGTYTLTVTVTDLKTEQKDTRTVDFIVVKG